MIYETKFKDVIYRTIKNFPDPRGRFLEVSRNSEFNIVQTNVSVSKEMVFRGLHYQLKNPQSKLITVLKGEIIDVIIDLRKNSETFGCVESFQLRATKDQLYVPEGFAHGFYAMSQDTIVMYGCGDYYAPDDEYGVYINDKFILNQITQFGFAPVEEFIMTSKDQRFPRFKDIPDEFLF